MQQAKSWVTGLAERGHCLILKQFFLDRSYAMMARRKAVVRSCGANIKNMLQ
jgi:hypothetical protein